MRRGRPRLRLRETGNKGTMTLGMPVAIGFAARVNYTELYMAKTAPKSKSAMETLVDSFSDLVEEARERMSPEEFQQAEKEFDEIVSKVKARASRTGRRESA